MLCDPKWEQKTKADPLTLESLIAWLERQPPEGRYWYLAQRNCVLARYFRAAGYTDFWIGSTTWISERFGRQSLPIEFQCVAEPEVSWRSGFGLRSTFGAALERARFALRIRGNSNHDHHVLPSHHVPLVCQGRLALDRRQELTMSANKAAEGHPGRWLRLVAGLWRLRV